MSDHLTRLTTALSDRYTIERELGRGGMAVVYLARDLKHEREVALKVLRPELAATVGAERFLREIRIAAQLSHPHILPLHDSGEADGFLFYVMPYVEGQSLRDRLVRERELPISEAVRILRDVVDALSLAHSHEVVHRDIKPDNVMLSGRHALVTDFGVAKALSQAKSTSDLTTAGVALGTPAYMSPEQAVADEQVDHRSDIYAVGALAYELLTGRPPFLGTTAQMVLSAHVADPPDPVTKYRENVSLPLEHLVMRCLEKKPADRWQSAEELLAQLEAVVTPSGGMTPTTTRPITAVGMGKQQRSAPFTGSAFIAVAAVLVLGSVWLLPKILGPNATEPDAELPRLVVLPFENLGAPEDEYFADGITDEIMSRIGRLSGVGVIARSRAMQYKNTEKTLSEITAELDVDFVLEGTVRWSKASGGASRVRVSPQLIRGTDETQVWAEPFEAELANVFELQANVAETVAQALDITLVGGEAEAIREIPTENMEAYEYFLQGEAHFEDAFPVFRGIQEALDRYQRAVELDPNFALAYARLSMAHGGFYWSSRDKTTERLDKQKAAADTALQLDPNLPEAHFAQGMYLYYCCLDYDGARIEIERALDARPNDHTFLTFLGVTHQRGGSGDMERAAEIYTRAADLDPLALMPNLQAAFMHRYLRDHDQADRYFDRLMSIVPEPWWVYVQRARIKLERDGSTEQALQLLQDASDEIEDWSFERLIAVVAGPGASDPEAQYFARIVCNVADCRGVLTELRGALTELPGNSGLVGHQKYHIVRAELHEWLGEPEFAHIHFDSAVLALEELAEREPTDPVWHASLSLAYAALGRADSARSEIERAIELQPISVDAWQGHNWIALQPQISVRIGDHDAAIAQLDRLLGMHSWITVPLIRVDPIWDPLRDHPGFQALLEKYGGD